MWNRSLQYIFVGLAAVCMLSAPVWAQSSSSGLTQQFEGFNLVGYTEGGEKQWDIKGDTADVQANIVDITNVDANAYGQEVMNLKARNGKIDKGSGNVQLEDDVVITSERGAQMKTDTLEWNRTEDLVVTNDKVDIKDDKMHIMGQGMRAHPTLKEAKLNSDVRAKIEAESKDPEDNIITITSEGPMEIDQLEQKAVFHINVMAVEENTGRTLKADRMEVVFDAQSKKITRLVCTGNVSVEQGKNVTYSESLVYHALEQRMVLTGRPKLILNTSEQTSVMPFEN